MTTNKELVQNLVMLGKENPQLRPNIRPLLAALKVGAKGITAASRTQHTVFQMPRWMGMRNWAEVWEMLLDGMPKDFRRAFDRKDAAFFASLVLHHVYDTSGDYYDPRDPDPDAPIDMPLAPPRKQIERYISQNWEDVAKGFDAHS